MSAHEGKPIVDATLWFVPSDCEGKHYLVGNPHTFRGRMSAWCPTKQTYYFVSASQIREASPEARAWVAGFLAGNEPRPPQDYDDQSDFGSAEYSRWMEQVEAFRRTGTWTPPTISVDSLGADAVRACETLCRFPDVFAGRVAHPLAGRSMDELLEGLDYATLRRAIDRYSLTAFVQRHPDCVDAWQGYSADKRTTGGFYFLSNQCQVGSVEAGGVRTDALTFESVAEACATYILRELDYWAALSERGRVRPPASAVDHALRLDEETARLLFDALYALSEHEAAGAPIPKIDRRGSEVLGRLLSDLGRHLGRHGRLA